MNKIIVLTGGSRGLGKELTRTLLERGNTVIVGAREEARLEDLKREMRSERLRAFLLDVSSDESVNNFFGKIKNEFLEIDVLINNAGLGKYGPMLDLNFDDSREMFETNFYGPIRCWKEAVKILKKGNATIINISSLVSYRAGFGIGAYAATKAALDRATDSFRLEVQEKGIHVFQINPGFMMETSFHEKIKEHELPKKNENSIEEVVLRIVDIVENKNGKRFINFYGKLFATLAVIAPAFFDYLQTKKQKKKQKLK